MPFWRVPFSRRRRSDGPSQGDATDGGEVSDGSLRFVVEKAGNDSPPAYQEAGGAPVEVNSPLGYSVGPVTIIFLNVSKMIGTGVYSTREHFSLSEKERNGAILSIPIGHG